MGVMELANARIERDQRGFQWKHRPAYALVFQLTPVSLASP
jgi:hypothetical protein